MIARTWHGRVPAAKADPYYGYMLRTGLADIRSAAGNRGLLLLRSWEEDEAHYTLISFWDSFEAIRDFAGEDYERARYYPEDDAYLLEREEKVTHAEVVARD